MIDRKLKYLHFIGKKIHYLTILDVTSKFYPKANRWRELFVCRCDCGKIVAPFARDVLRDHSKSCSCHSVSVLKKRVTKHYGAINRASTPEYEAWRCMKARCYNPKNKRYSNYGGRNIIVCDRWINSFENFLLDMGKRPTDKHSIDRINNDGNYEPSNCKWSTYIEQANNRRPRKKETKPRRRRK